MKENYVGLDKRPRLKSLLLTLKKIGTKFIVLILWGLGIFLLISTPEQWARWGLAESLGLQGALSWIIWIKTIPGSILLYLGWEINFRAKSGQAITADLLLGKDKRPPVVYLRPFRLDQEDKNPMKLDSFEEKLRKTVSGIGPFIAIGQPGEEMPTPGAARKYVDSSEWQSAITAWIQIAQLVLIYFEESEGVWWELETVGKILPPQKIFIIINIKATDYDEFREKAQGRFLYDLPLPEPSITFSGFSIVETIQGVIYYDQQGRQKFKGLGDIGLSGWLSQRFKRKTFIKSDAWHSKPMLRHREEQSERITTNLSPNEIEVVARDICGVIAQASLVVKGLDENKQQETVVSGVKGRHWVLTIYMSLLLLIHGIFLLGFVSTVVFNGLSDLPVSSIYFGFYFLVELVNFIGIVGLFRWKKWGFYGYALVNGIAFFVALVDGNPFISAFLVNTAHILLLFLALTFGKSRAAWIRLE